MGVQTKWAEKAVRSSRDSWKNLITSRIDTALERVNRDNSEYIELCQQQQKAERLVDVLLKKLDAEEQDIVRQYYDKEIEGWQSKLQLTKLLN